MARQLIAETKHKSADNSPSKKYESPQLSPIKKLGYTISDFDNFSKISPSHRMFEKNGNGSPLKFGDKISPKIEKRGVLVSVFFMFLGGWCVCRVRTGSYKGLLRVKRAY